MGNCAVERLPSVGAIERLPNFGLSVDFLRSEYAGNGAYYNDGEDASFCSKPRHPLTACGAIHHCIMRSEV